VLFALAARLPYFVHSDFPLNDGGLFAAMTQDLFDNHFALPAVTTYNADGIPFAYPPLAFYLSAALHAVTGVDIIALERWLPLIENLATVLAVVGLARALLGTTWVAGLAPIVFALLPRSYEWMIMGGGLTRSLGFLLAVGCVLQAAVAARSWRPWRVALSAVLAGLALATHLEEGLFALYSAVLVLVCYARGPRLVLTAGAIGLGAVVVSAPWWLYVIAHHGLEPFRSASLTSGWSTPGTLLAALGEFLAPASVPLSALGALGLLGAAVSTLRGQFFLPVWLVAIFLLTPRSAPSEAVLPLACLASIAAVDVLLPPLLSAVRSTRAAVFARSLSLFRTPDARLIGATLTVLVLLAGVYRVWPRLPLDRYSLDSLPPGERAAMAWLAVNTAPDEQFLVLSSTLSWEEDMASEWFPALTGRRSVLTPQGAEWLPERLHARKVCLFQRVRDVSGWQNGVADLEAWASERGVTFSGLYVSTAVRGQVDWSILIASATASPNYTVLLDTPDAMVLRRNSPIVPRWPESGQFVVASDCGSLADEGPAVMADFQGRYGSRAAAAWVAEHEASLPAPFSVTSLLGQGAAVAGRLRAV
jgi:hypothetical protein